MDFQNITYQQQGKTVFLTIQRESQLNALNAETISELLQAVKQAETDENVRGIILTGAGQKGFCCWSRYQRVRREDQRPSDGVIEIGA